MDIIALRRNGCSIRKIAKLAGIHRKTVKRHLESNSFPTYKKEERRISILEPYTQIIRDYLEQDDYQATWIYDRLKKNGLWGKLRYGQDLCPIDQRTKDPARLCPF